MSTERSTHLRPRILRPAILTLLALVVGSTACGKGELEAHGDRAGTEAPAPIEVGEVPQGPDVPQPAARDDQAEQHLEQPATKEPPMMAGLGEGPSAAPCTGFGCDMTATPPPAAEACGDGACRVDESCKTCPADCGDCGPEPGVCGDGVCAADESCRDCGDDCGPCVVGATCGDGACDPTEACDSCAEDCGACPPPCGDDLCEPGESCGSCAVDCGACPPPAAVCGDGACNGAERCDACPGDCGACAPTCGDGACAGDETCGNCAQDCGACPPPPPVCGDGACNGDETCGGCAQDCGACPPVCGDGQCDGAEGCGNCAQDCGACPPPPPSCGDGACNADETCGSCARDCGACPPVCGDGACNGAETCGSCASDCGACPPPPPVCGDGACNGDETCGSCAGDCGACPPRCGDGQCNGAETCGSCAGDCGACPPPPPVCGDGQCNGDETCGSCPGDCGACPPRCGDGQCNGTETCNSCAGDCGACPPPPPACGDGACNGDETCGSCARDCGACPPRCGDGQCNGDETCGSCAGDCGACPPPPPACGDGACNGAESCDTCPGDCGACPAAGLPGWIGVTGLTHKLRPTDALPADQVADIEAARNEFEGFQIAFRGGDGGRTVQAATLSTLSGPNGARITADNAVIYKVAQYDVPSASNDEGDAGEWPDPLVPHVDPYFGERRNAFPLQVPANRVAAILIDLHVPTGVPAGNYTGRVTLQTSGGQFEVPVRLRVFDFDLPSTSSLPTMFGIGWDAGCVAHHGSYEACGGDPGILHYGALYAKVALDNRISLGQMVYFWPRNDDWSIFEGAYGALLDGTHDGRLAGAKMTTLATHARWAADPEASVRRWKAGVEARDWDVTLFEYVCDEPPYGCQWADIARWAEPVRRAGVHTLVTTGLPEATAAGVLGSIDLITPLMNWVGPNGAMGTHADYRNWMNQDPNRKMWWYQSCISHGCGNGCDTSRGDAFTGWPSYVIDASAIQARAMEWFTFRHDVGGELYFATTDQLTTAWTNQCRYSGSGDGTLFYPGKPSIIGGQTDIPIESQRMKLIREGLEDYEYLHLLDQLGEGAFARAQVDQLFPSAHTVTATTADELKAVRRALAERIEARN